ncbi:transcription initiation factor TFIID [Salix suchowensis]|nr:transcription initiation factor TFIID [Salix suchowensis]
MAKMQTILAQFTEEQMSRYESFHRSALQKTNMKRPSGDASFISLIFVSEHHWIPENLFTNDDCGLRLLVNLLKQPEL